MTNGETLAFAMLALMIFDVGVSTIANAIRGVERKYGAWEAVYAIAMLGLLLPLYIRAYAGLLK